MPSLPQISILSTAYNESLHIAEMIESVLAQTHENWELLMIDDASTDDTAEIIERFASADPRIRLVSRARKLGKVAAFNTAYAASSGDILALMGADDTMPPDSLAIRSAALFGDYDTTRMIGYFKLRTFSDDSRFHGMTLPRGDAGSRSGPSLTMSRALARSVFPIPDHLVSEDSWLGEATAALADVQIDDLGVVVNYRIHAGNSNPRHKSFAQMTNAMHRRAAAYPALLAEDRFELSSARRRQIELLAQAEVYRHEGKTFKLLGLRSMPLIDRLAMASMSSPLLFRFRTRFYRLFSGRRGR